MKQITLLFLILLIWGCTPSRNITAAAVQNALHKQEAAWKEGNMGGFMQGYWQNDSLMLMAGKELIYGWQNALDAYKASYPDSAAMQKLSYTIISIKPCSSTEAIVAGSWHLNGNAEPGGHFVLLFRKINKVWKIVMDHIS